MKFILPVGLFCMLLSCSQPECKLSVSSALPFVREAFLPGRCWGNSPASPSFDSGELLKRGVSFFNSLQEEADYGFDTNVDRNLENISRIGEAFGGRDSTTIISSLYLPGEYQQSGFLESPVSRLALLY